MKRPFWLTGWVAVAIAVFSFAQLTLAQNELPTVISVRDSNPNCQDAVAICQMQGLANELEITNVTTSGSSCDSSGFCTSVELDPALGVEFRVRWKVLPTGAVDVFDDSPEASTPEVSLPGFQAVIAEGKTKSNFYCGESLTSVSAISAPAAKKNSFETPTKISFCWGPRRPCLQTPEQVAAACAEFEDPNNPGADVKNYLQAHKIRPRQPINICSCRPDLFTAQFCDPSVPGSCPVPQGGLTAVNTQGTATIGKNTCQRVVIGGRALYIGDTC